MSTSRKSLLWGALYSAALLALGFAVFTLDAARSRASAATANLAAMHAMASTIHDLKQLKSSAIQAGKQVESSVQRWLEIASKAGISDENAVELKPSKTQSISDTNYQREDVTVELNAVTLQQVTQFMIHCPQDELAFQPTALALRALFDDSSDRERWHADVTLTRLLFAAKKRQPE